MGVGTYLHAGGEIRGDSPALLGKVRKLSHLVRRRLPHPLDVQLLLLNPTDDLDLLALNKSRPGFQADVPGRVRPAECQVEERPAVRRGSPHWRRLPRRSVDGVQRQHAAVAHALPPAPASHLGGVVGLAPLGSRFSLLLVDQIVEDRLAAKPVGGVCHAEPQQGAAIGPPCEVLVLHQGVDADLHGCRELDGVGVLDLVRHRVASRPTHHVVVSDQVALARHELLASGRIQNQLIPNQQHDAAHGVEPGLPSHLLPLPPLDGGSGLQRDERGSGGRPRLVGHGDLQRRFVIGELQTETLGPMGRFLGPDADAALGQRPPNLVRPGVLVRTGDVDVRVTVPDHEVGQGHGGEHFCLAAGCRPPEGVERPLAPRLVVEPPSHFKPRVSAHVLKDEQRRGDPPPRGGDGAVLLVEVAQDVDHHLQIGAPFETAELAHPVDLVVHPVIIQKLKLRDHEAAVILPLVAQFVDGQHDLKYWSGEERAAKAGRACWCCRIVHASTDHGIRQSGRISVCVPPAVERDASNR